MNRILSIAQIGHPVLREPTAELSPEALQSAEVQQFIDDLIAIALFDDLPIKHHGDPVTDMVNDGHVVADEQIRHLVLFLDVLEERNDPAPDRLVETGCRLVKNDHVRGTHEGSGDSYPLQLAT